MGRVLNNQRKSYRSIKFPNDPPDDDVTIFKSITHELRLING